VIEITKASDYGKVPDFALPEIAIMLPALLRSNIVKSEEDSPNFQLSHMYFALTKTAFVYMAIFTLNVALTKKITEECSRGHASPNMTDK